MRNLSTGRHGRRGGGRPAPALTFLNPAATAALAALAAAPSAHAHSWINPAGGSILTPSNWSPTSVPGPADPAVFGLAFNPNAHVMVPGDVTTGPLEVRSGGVGFRFADLGVTDSYVYTVPSIDVRTSLGVALGTIRSGSLAVGTNAGTASLGLSERGGIEVTGSAVVGTAPGSATYLTIGSGPGYSRLDVDHDLTLGGPGATVEVLLTRAVLRAGGTLALNAGTTVSPDPASVIRAGQLVSGGGYLTWFAGNVTVGGPAGLTVGAGQALRNDFRIEDGGLLSVAATTTLDGRTVTVGNNAVSPFASPGTFSTGKLLLTNGGKVVLEYAGVLELTQEGVTFDAGSGDRPFGDAYTLPAGAKLKTAEPVVVGDAVAGALTLASSVVEAPAVFVGASPNGSGVLVVDGFLDAPHVVVGGKLSGGETPTPVSGGKGVLSGTGSISGVVTNLGRVDAGRDALTTLAVGGYVQGPAATLHMQIGGTEAGTGYDQLVVAGDAHLAGALDVSFAGGFVSATGDTFTLLAALGTVSGTFADPDADGHLVLAGRRLRLGYDGSSVALTDVGPTVPEPAALLFPVLAALVQADRPRRRRLCRS
jgi:hypothetical protein